MQAAAALSPILLILILMVGAGWSAARAGSVGLAAALAISLGVFDYGVAGDAAPGRPAAVGGAFAEAGFIAATILWIIFPALCIHELQTRSGAIGVIRGALKGLSPDPRVLAILIAWFFALFLEGAAGFGTPVALAAPILVGLGFPPIPAVSMVLVGHAAGVSFGAVGTPIQPQLAVTALGERELSWATALLHGLLGWILLLFLVAIAGARKAAATGIDGRSWCHVTAAAALFLLPYMAIAHWIGPELPTLGGALMGGVGFVLVVRRRGTAGPDTADAPSAAALLRAALPYLVLMALILATRLTPLKEVLTGFVLQWTLFDRFSGSMQPLYHPGTMLLLGFVVGGLTQGNRPASLAVAAGAAAARLVPVMIALFAMLGLSRLMVHAGIIAVLAEGAAGALGPAWPLVAPTVGALGTFVTGSATASNILFTEFQAATAAALDLPLLLLVAAQGFGAAVGNVVCPHNIVAGGATVGLTGREGDILKRTIVPCGVYVAAGGVLLWLLVG